MSDSFFTAHYKHPSQHEIVRECSDIINAEHGTRYGRFELCVNPITVGGWVSLYGNNRLDMETLSYSLNERLPGAALFFASYGDDVTFAVNFGPDVLLQIEQATIPPIANVRTTLPADEIAMYLGIAVRAQRTQATCLRTMLNAAVTLDFTTTISAIDDFFESLHIAHRLRAAHSDDAYTSGSVVFDGTQVNHI